MRKAWNSPEAADATSRIPTTTFASAWAGTVHGPWWVSPPGQSSMPSARSAAGSGGYWAATPTAVCPCKVTTSMPRSWIVELGDTIVMLLMRAFWSEELVTTLSPIVAVRSGPTGLHWWSLSPATCSGPLDDPRPKHEATLTNAAAPIRHPATLRRPIFTESPVLVAGPAMARANSVSPGPAHRPPQRELPLHQRTH